MKKTAEAHRYLAELKGVAVSIPNEAILINTLTLQEAKDSSEIENIVTTHDELYKANLFEGALTNPAAKEVQDYAFALKESFQVIRRQKIIRLSDILAVQEHLEKNNAGLRKLPGTALKNSRTGEVVYTPPQHAEVIAELMNNLIRYINDDELCDADPLVMMAIIHHQFESIHPFYDGNGRTGRILNILYLVSKGLLNLPVLYLSRYIIHSKANYYAHLQQVRESGNWEPWLLYMLDGVIDTARNTISLIEGIKQLISRYKHRMRDELPKIYRIGEAKQDEASASTANRYLAVIRAVLIMARDEWDWIDNAPKVRLYKEPKKRIRWITQNEAKKLIAELPKHLADMAEFSLSTGLRQSNVSFLKWDQISLERRMAWIHAEDSKNGKALAVVLNNNGLFIINGGHRHSLE